MLTSANHKRISGHDTLRAMAICLAALACAMAGPAFAAEVEIPTGDRPQLQAAYTRQAPTIDGKLDDACWEHGVAATDFITRGNYQPAEAPTVARVCYDRQNLYVMFRCTEPILKVVEQRQQEFVANVKQHDGKIYHDAACAVLLQPGGEGPVYEIGANALGTVTDGRSDSETSVWSSRDLSWESGAKAAARKSDKGQWTLEISIPLKALGGPPKAGDAWGLALGRQAPSRSETSSWNRSAGGFHAPSPMGRMAFVTDPNDVKIDPPARQLRSGANTLSAQLPARLPSGGVYLWSSIQGPNGPQTSRTLIESGDAKGRGTHTFQVPEDQIEPVTLSYGVTTARDQTTLYRSAQTVRPVKSTTTPRLVLSTPGAYELSVGGKKVRSGDSAEDERITLPIQDGVNDIRLRLDAGYGTVGLTGGGLDAMPLTWRARQGNGKWQRVEGRPASGSDGRRYGRPGGAIELEHALLSNDVHLWPDRTIYLARGSAQHVNFVVDGVKGRALSGLTLYLAAPEGIDVVSATGYYGDSKKQPKYTLSAAGRQTIDGRPMKVYRVDADSPVRHPSYPMSIVQVLLKPDAEAAPDSDGNMVLRHWVVAEDGAVSQPIQQTPVRLLPRLNGKQPKRFIVELWGSYFTSIDNHDFGQKTLETAKASGVNDIVAAAPWVRERAHPLGIKTIRGVAFKGYSMNIAPFLEEHPDARLIDHNGKPSSNQMCTTLLVDRGWPVVAKQVKRIMDESQPDVIEEDYETNPFTGDHACYCDRCLAAFREHAGLGRGQSLTPKTIQSKHHDAWMDFMTDRSTQYLKRLRQTVKGHNPKVDLGVYSGYQRPRTQEKYGIDWEKIGKAGAADIAGMGYGRSPSANQASLDALWPEIQTVFGVLLRPGRPGPGKPERLVTTAKLLRRAADARGGVLVYDRQPMDGRCWYALAEATRLIAEHEDLFLNGERRPVSGVSEDDGVLLVGDNTALMLVLNGSSQAKTYRVKIPADYGQGQGFYRDKTVDPGDYSLKLEAGDAVAIVFGQRR